MAERFNKNHRAVYEAIKNNPNQTIIFIHDAVKLKIRTTQNYLGDLREAGLIQTNKERCKGYAKYRVTDKDYDMAAAEFSSGRMDIEGKYPIQYHEPDPLLDKAISYELTDDQWHYIKANPTLSRRDIAKKLGIPRTVLLAAIDRRKDRERGDKHAAQH